MGQIAEDALDGWTCSWCGIFFDDGHGFPVVCRDCSEESSPKELEKLGLQRSTLEEL